MGGQNTFCYYSLSESLPISCFIQLKMWIKLVPICFMLVCLCGTNGNPTDVSSRIYENKIIEMLEDLRLRMCYHDPQGLPQLEPWILNDRVDFNFKDGSTRINGFVQNLKAEGLSTFIVDYLTFSITLKFNISMSVPKLVISGDYGLDANVGGFFKVAGIGPFRIELGGFKLDTSAAFVYLEKMMLKDLKLGPKLQAFLSNIENLTADKHVTLFFNNIASSSIPDIVNKHIPAETIQSVADYLENLASSYLKGMSIRDLLDILAGGGSLLPPLDLEKACKLSGYGLLD